MKSRLDEEKARLIWVASVGCDINNDTSFFSKWKPRQRLSCSTILHIIMKIPCECVTRTELWEINFKLWGTQQIARILMVHLLQPLPGFMSHLQLLVLSHGHTVIETALAEIKRFRQKLHLSIWLLKKVDPKQNGNFPSNLISGKGKSCEPGASQQGWGPDDNLWPTKSFRTVLTACQTCFWGYWGPHNDGSEWVEAHFD